MAMKTVARVVVDVAADREFDYRVPESARGGICVGTRVVVPFGPRRVSGYVTGFSSASSHPRLKEIISVKDDRPFVTEPILELARWMAAYYCAPVERAIRTVLPGAVRKDGARFRSRKHVSLVEGTSGGSDESGDEKVPPKQRKVLELLREEGTLPLQDVLRRAEVSQAPVRSLEKRGLVTIHDSDMRRDPLANRTILRTTPLELMPEQKRALELIRDSLENGSPGVVLLYGVTGSGKTEVYLQAIAEVLSRGQGAIVLVPEISLTPQTVERFVARFGDSVAVLHSHLSDGERHDEWHRIRDGKADIVIGARSAVFAPLPDLGLIVVDEEHEPSYKQEDAPRYNARDVAVMRGHMQKCPVVLGSATPALESWHNTRIGKYGLATLPRRADDRQMPLLRVVDMRVETERSGHVCVFSRELVEGIRLRLERAEQTILFLNRRGYSTSLICPSCGFVAGCGNCSVSYTYHRKVEKLICHICGDESGVPQRCPSCMDPAFKFSGMGTQRIESVVNKLCPHATVQRMDTDVTRSKDAYESILGRFRSGKIDILIGTQMIAKGLHFPNVTLVGVMYADLSLHMPDFRAGERTFQLLAQVAGRAGRGEVPGEVIVQTYTPANPSIQAARRMDFEGFCDQELEFRKELSFPPFSHLVCITASGTSEAKVSFWLAALAREARKVAPESVLMSEPAPAPLARARGQYRCQLMLRSRSVSRMTRAIRAALATVKAPKGIAVTVDVDAMSLM